MLYVTWGCCHLISEIPYGYRGIKEDQRKWRRRARTLSKMTAYVCHLEKRNICVQRNQVFFFRCQSKGDGARVQSAPDCWRTRLSCKRRTQARLSSQKKQLGRRRRGQHMSRTQDVCSRVVEVKSSNWHMMPEEMKETPLGSRAQGKEKKESMSSPPSRYGYRSSAQCSCCTLRWEIVVRFVAEIFCWSSYYCTRGSRKWTVFAIFVMHAFANVGRKEILRQTSISGC